jgi:malate dehydrogenase (oxaloacetate-decarboxylating)
MSTTLAESPSNFSLHNLSKGLQPGQAENLLSCIMSSKETSKFKNLPRAASGPLECPYDVSHPVSSTMSNIYLTSQAETNLKDARFNKGSAFTQEERKTFNLHGMLPPNIQTLEEQVQRAYDQYSSRGEPLAKNTFMASMKAQNEVLYYKV